MFLFQFLYCRSLFFNFIIDFLYFTIPLSNLFIEKLYFQSILFIDWRMLLQILYKDQFIFVKIIQLSLISCHNLSQLFLQFGNINLKRFLLFLQIMADIIIIRYFHFQIWYMFFSFFQFFPQHVQFFSCCRQFNFVFFVLNCSLFC